jgi:N-acetyl-gamma-glutamyl-phosphate reductase
VRGIHATLRLSLKVPASAADLAAAVNAFYDGSPFISASVDPPRLNEVVGTNRCGIGVAARGRTAVVTAVLDNLVKGAAGGGVQWMNRLLGLDEAAGLRLAGLGWR